MQWEVSGTDAQSGKAKRVLVEADTEDSARRRAERGGISVAQVKHRQQSAAPVAVAAQPSPVVCANCDRTIGRLEKSQVWQGEVVCQKCYDQLAPVAQYATPTAAVPTGKNPIICPNPNCGYVGAGKKVAKGSAVLMILLFLCGFLPGIIYAIIYNGSNIVCPKCGMKVRDA